MRILLTHSCQRCPVKYGLAVSVVDALLHPRRAKYQIALYELEVARHEAEHVNELAMEVIRTGNYKEEAL